MQRVIAAIRDIVFITGITTILLLTCFLGGEYWARKTAVRADDTLDFTTQTFAYHPWAAFRNTPGFVYQVGNLKIVKINKYGWRGPEPAIERPRNVKRALLLGDSVPFSGWGCREGVTMGGALSRALELRSDEEWEVINTAVGAGFSSMQLATLAHEGMQFKPDAVISFGGINDFVVLLPYSLVSIGDKSNTFKEVLYHNIHQKLQEVYDPRTGRYNQSIVMGQLANESELLKRLAKSFEHASNQVVGGGGNGVIRPIDNLDRLNHFVDNQLAMSYLAAGSGAPFLSVLQPYFSLQHKVIGGDIDRAVIKATNDTDPTLLPWLDVVYPAMRSKMMAAAATHPSLHLLDISLMFTSEQVFADNAHMRCEDSGLSMPGNELMAARMADEIVMLVYPGQALPDWRKTHIEGTPFDWKDQAYLDANPDVAALVAEGKYRSGYAHYIDVGFLKGRHSGFPSWNENAYLADNPDVAAAVAGGTFASGFDHYLKGGRAEGRLKGRPPRWVEGTYLWANPDVAQAIARGEFKSGLDHFVRSGAKDGRNGGFSGWDEEGYLFAHADVRNAIDLGTFSSGLHHYLTNGAAEHRPIRLGTYTPKE